MVHVLSVCFIADLGDAVSDEDLLTKPVVTHWYVALGMPCCCPGCHLSTCCDGCVVRRLEKFKCTPVSDILASIEVRTDLSAREKAMAKLRAAKEHAQGRFTTPRPSVGRTLYASNMHHLYDQLLFDMFHPVWEIRHGALVGLKQVFKVYSAHELGGTEPSGESKTCKGAGMGAGAGAGAGGDAASAKPKKQPKQEPRSGVLSAGGSSSRTTHATACLHDIVLRCLCVLLLDR